MAKVKTNNSRRVSEKKIKEVEEIAKNISNNTTVVVVSIKNLPAKQLQKIKKEIREKAKIRIGKKSIIQKAIEKTNKPDLKPLTEYIKDGSALLVSDEDGFDLALWLSENRSLISAKTGQVAEADIAVQSGQTDLVPGPVISELGNFGIQIEIKEGRIEIKKEKVIVKKGETITAAAAALLQKLDIKPFMIGIIPEVIYSSKEKKIYAGIKISREQTLKNLAVEFSKSLGFAQKIVYYCKETISYLIGKANTHAKAFEMLLQKSKVQEELTLLRYQSQNKLEES